MNTVDKMNTVDEILEHYDNLIDKWHEGNGLLELHTYLELDVEKYNFFVCYPVLFAEEILNKK